MRSIKVKIEKGGAIISYYINKPIEEKKEVSKENKNEIRHDSIKLEIFDGSKKIRTLQFKTPKESGIHKTTWYLREKGVARASRKISKSKREPGRSCCKTRGLSFKNDIRDTQFTFEQDITVSFDPRLEISQDAIHQKYDASKELEGYQAKIAAMVKQIG